MEMYSEEPMFYTEYNGDNDYPQTMLFSDSNQSLLNPDDQASLLVQDNQVSILDHENPVSLQNDENQDQENEILSLNHDNHNQTTEQSEQTQQPLYKLDNIDTKALIKTDIKQLILTKISEEINSKALSDMRYEAQEQMSTLRNKTNNLQNKKQDLDEQVKSDDNRLTHLEVTLLTTNEMNELLKENKGKITVRYRELHINDILEIGVQQHQNLDLKKSLMTKLEKEKECLKDAEVLGFQRNVALKTELAQKREVLRNLTKRDNDLIKSITTLEEEIEKNVVKKQKLNKKLAVSMNQRTVIEKEFTQDKELLSSLFLKKDAQTARFTELNNQKLTLEQKLRDTLLESDTAEANLTDTENHILEKQKTLDSLENSLKTIKHEFQESSKMLQSDYDVFGIQLNEVKTQLSTSMSDNSHLTNELNKLHTMYIIRCDEKFALIHDTLDHQNSIHDVNLNKLKQELQNNVQRNKLEELKKQYEVSLASLDSLEKNITREQENVCSELMESKLMFEAMQAKYSTCFLEMEEKRQYLLKNSKFLEEKAENLHHEVTELGQSIKRLQEENDSSKSMIQQKSNLLDECKNKLTLSRKARVENEQSLKSGLKSPNKENIPKKVKFNEILSFKSPSSSEVSNVQGENITQLLETSLRDWLEENTDKIEQEY